jgi:hypothetical protein
MTAAEDTGIGATLWHTWIREELSELQATFMEPLSTGLHRLLAFQTLVRGPLPSGAGPEWARAVQESDISQVTRDLMQQLEAAGLPVRASLEAVLDQFKGMRSQADQRYATELAQQPLSERRIERFTTAVNDGWSEARELPAVLTHIGSRVSLDAIDYDDVEITRVPRALFVANTNMIGEGWFGKDLGRQLATLEANNAFRYWFSLGERVPMEWTMDDLIGAMEQSYAGGVPRGALLLPYDWPVDEWARVNRPRLLASGIRVVFSSGIPGGDALFVSPGDESWSIGEHGNLRVDLQPIPLEPDADQAFVVVTLGYPRPVASGRPLCWLIGTRQLTGDQGQRPSDIE